MPSMPVFFLVFFSLLHVWAKSDGKAHCSAAGTARKAGLNPQWHSFVLLWGEIKALQEMANMEYLNVCALTCLGLNNFPPLKSMKDRLCRLTTRPSLVTTHPSLVA